jgi:cytochrome c oxidase assembly factor CtaG
MAAFVLGLDVVVIALISPLDRLGRTLLSARIMQHDLLVTVAPGQLFLG